MKTISSHVSPSCWCPVPAAAVLGQQDGRRRHSRDAAGSHGAVVVTLPKAVLGAIEGRVHGQKVTLGGGGGKWPSTMSRHVSLS